MSDQRITQLVKLKRSELAKLIVTARYWREVLCKESRLDLETIKILCEDTEELIKDAMAAFKGRYIKHDDWFNTVVIEDMIRQCVPDDFSPVEIFGSVAGTKLHVEEPMSVLDPDPTDKQPNIGRRPGIPA